MLSDSPNISDGLVPATNNQEPQATEPASAIRPDLKRTLKDLLVQEEVSDSDMEMFDKASVDNENMNPNDHEEVDPNMCVECGDQVPTSSIIPWRIAINE